MVAEFKMNQEKLKQLQAQVRIGGKGTARRKKKVVHRTATTDDKKLQSSLKKLSVNNIPGIEEVNMIKDDGSVIHFNNPKVQASLAANTFAVTGHAENKQITEMLPGILNQLGAESLTHLKRLASNVTGGAGLGEVAGAGDDDDDEVPDLVENFDEASKDEKATEDEKASEDASEEAKISEDQVKNDAAELEPVEQKSEPVVDEIDALIAQTEAVAQELDEAEVSEDQVENDAPELEPVAQNSETEVVEAEVAAQTEAEVAPQTEAEVAPQTEAEVAPQTEAVAQELDEVEVIEVSQELAEVEVSETPAKDEPAKDE